MDQTGFEAGSERRPGTVERAFQIARVGGCEGMSDLVRILKGERFEQVDEHLSGQSIRRDLRRTWEAAGAKAEIAGAEQAPGTGT